MNKIVINKIKDLKKRLTIDINIFQKELTDQPVLYKEVCDLLIECKYVYLESAELELNTIQSELIIKINKEKPKPVLDVVKSRVSVDEKVLAMKTKINGIKRTYENLLTLKNSFEMRKSCLIELSNYRVK